jgi:hypothetical protein
MLLETEQMKKCQNCGHPILQPVISNYCTNCGGLTGVPLDNFDRHYVRKQYQIRPKISRFFGKHQKVILELIITNLKRRAILGILVVVVFAFVFFAPLISAPLSISLSLTHYIGAYHLGRQYYFSPLSPIPIIPPRCV